MQRKIHNPKSQFPSIYLPSWLCQVSLTLISIGAKMLYGRLSQWSNNKGQVHRSGHLLAKELGTNRRQLCRWLKELKDLDLIDTFQSEEGGENYFIFYDHPWMYEPIIDELCYRSEPPDPPENLSKRGVTNRHEGCDKLSQEGVTNPAHINKILNKINNKDLLIDSIDRKPKVSESEAFKKFWAIYPRKIAKKKCLKIWKSRGLDSRIDQILEKLAEQIRADDQWRQGFIPHPSTYLNQDRWEDEITLPKEDYARKHKLEAKKVADEAATRRLKLQEQVNRETQTSRIQPKSKPPVSLKSSLIGHLKSLNQKVASEIENLGANFNLGSSSPEIGT